MPVSFLTTLVDPRFKRRGFITDAQANVACLALKRELAVTSQKQLIQPPEERVPEVPQTKRSRLWSDFDTEAGHMTARTRAENSDAEYRRWFSECLVGRSEDPITWWTDINNMAKFPILGTVALRILVAQATSVASERVFSSAGRVISDLRSRLTDDNAEMLIFLHQNMHKGKFAGPSVDVEDEET